MRPLNIVLLVVSIASAIGATVAAGWLGRSLGLPAFILLVGVAIVALSVAFTLLINRENRDVSDVETSSDTAALQGAFEALLPSVIMNNGVPAFANKAYLQLARELGVADMEGEQVSVDRLFGRKEKTSSAAIFRLHHTSSDAGVSEETIRVLTDDSIRVFKVRVTPTDAGQLWQIEDAEEAQVAAIPMLREAPVGLFSVSVDGAVLEMNDVLRDWLGYAADTSAEILPDELPKNMDEFIENPESLLEGSKSVGRVMRCDTQLITKKGIASPTVMTANWHELESGDLYAAVAVYGHSGIGARPKQMEVSAAPLKLDSAFGQDAQSQTSLDVLGEAPFGVVQLDSPDLFNAKVTGANAAFSQMLGHTELSNVLFKSLFVQSSDTDKFIDAGVGGTASSFDVRLVGEDSSAVNVYFSQSVQSGCVGYIIDISQRKELEERLLQSHKMQAIGQLAGGIAHDFNNLLTVIRLNCDELLGRHPVGDPSYPELQQINQTVARSAGLVRKLLAFSRKQTMRVQRLNVTDTLSDLTVMLKQVMVAHIQLDVVHGRGLPTIQADPTQFESILMNLCVNARDAMVEKGKGGTITLSSSLAKPDDMEKDGIQASKNDGGFVVIKVSDTGTGMDEKTQKKIFEPFFTTKEQGKGTGLGLATVYGIVEQTGGHLRVQSTLGVGTTFSVYMPITTKADAAQMKPVAKIEKPKPSDLSGQGKILFVEDEDAVRSIAAKTLRKRGYTVIEACDGEEAYEILEEGEEQFDLMITDVVMPGMDGPTLLKKGRTLLGDANIVFISGYAEEEFSDLLAEEPDVTFLPKPFTLTQLAEKVKTVIGEAS